MQQLPANTIDLIVTDPPYLVNYQPRDGRKISGDTKDDWLLPAFNQMYRLLRNHSFAISFYGWGSADKFITAWRNAGFRMIGHLVFVKPYSSRKGYTAGRHESAYLLAKGKPQTPKTALEDVLRWGKYTGNKLHPTQKPLEILRPLIKNYSQVGDVVLDPFAGSGSTLVAARQLHRSWIGIELDKRYHRKSMNYVESKAIR